MSLEWSGSFGGQKNEDAYDIIQTDDKGFIIAGSTNSKNSIDIGNSNGYDGNGGNDFWIYKTDKDGKMLWSKTFGGTNDDVATSVTRASNGDYVIVGTTLSTDLDANYNGSNGGLLMIRLKEDGSLVSKRVFAGGRRFTELTYSATDNFSKAVVRSLPNGDLMVAATREIGSTNYTAKDLFLTRLTSSGDNLWEKTYGTRANDFMADMILTSDGAVLMVGCTESVSSDLSGSGNGFKDFLAIKVSQSGTEIWKKAWGGSNVDVFKTAIENFSKTGYILGGETTSNDKFITGALGQKDGIIVKLSKDGDLIWKKNLGGAGNDGLFRIIPVGTSGYMGIGTSDSEITGAPNKGPLTDAYTVNFDENANIKNQGLFGGADIDVARAGISISSTEWVLAGLSRSESGDLKTNKGSNDAWVFKLLPPPLTVFKTFYANLNEAQQGVVEFVTSYQQNLKLISLQKSVDNKNFSKLKDFTVYENTSSILKYSYVDKALQIGNNYYRIVYYDINDKQYMGPNLTFEFFPLATAPETNTGQYFKLYPNPVINRLNLDLVDKDAEIQVYDQMGIPYPTLQTFSFTDGWRLIFQHTPNPGMYILRINVKDNQISRKFYVR